MVSEIDIILKYLSYKITQMLSFIFLSDPTVTLSGVSWIFRGTAQQNNTVLTFNMYDTLNLICRANGLAISNQLIFIVSKGTIPTTATFDTASATLSVSNMGTLIFSDVDGLQAGFENFVIYTDAYISPVASNLLYQYRYVNVGVLRTEDSATYHCSAYYYHASTPAFKTSGGLTVVVNTRSDQARSTKNGINSFLAYSAAILGASKAFYQA